MATRIRVLVVWMLVLAMTAGSGSFSAMAQEGGAGEPLFEADGIEATIVAEAGLADVDAGSSLLLELLELAPDTELPTHQTTATELFYVLSGVVTFEDDFGFVSPIEAGRVVTLNAGVEYTIANAESEAGRLLRLRVADGAAATSGATPAAGGDDGASVLMQTPLEGIELDGARMYLGRAQFSPNADSGEQGHAGPIGIYIESGTVSVVSPSGLVGALDAGRAVSLPAETPLRASTGETEAVVFLAGLIGPEEPAFTRVWTEADGTPPGTVLASGETWRGDTAEMKVDVEPYQNSVWFEVTYTNTGSSATSTEYESDAISATDDRGGEWRLPSASCEESQELNPGASLSCTVRFIPPAGTARGPLVLTFHVDAFGEVQDATWQMEIDW